MNGRKLDDDQLLLRPFPQSQVGEQDLETLWRKYREDMISYAGIAIFLFGNKIVNGEVVLSNGMKEEYEIALDNNILIIPVGSTGYMAKELWLDLIERVDTDKYIIPENIRGEILELGKSDKSLDSIKELILEIILKLNRIP